MEIYFSDKNLDNSAKRKRKFGALKDKIEKRIVQLQTVNCLSDFERDFPGARCHEYSGNEKGTFTIDLTGNWRLRFRPKEPIPLKPDGGIDKKQVTSIIIIEVLDPH